MSESWKQKWTLSDSVFQLLRATHIQAQLQGLMFIPPPQNKRRSTALIQDQRTGAQTPEGVETPEEVGRGADPAASPSLFLCLLTSCFGVCSPLLQAGGEGPDELRLHIQLRFPQMLTG